MCFCSYINIRFGFDSAFEILCVCVCMYMYACLSLSLLFSEIISPYQHQRGHTSPLRFTNDDFNNCRASKHCVCASVRIHRHEQTSGCHICTHITPGATGCECITETLTTSRHITPEPVLNTRVMVRCEPWEGL